MKCIHPQEKLVKELQTTLAWCRPPRLPSPLWCQDLLVVSGNEYASFRVRSQGTSLWEMSRSHSNPELEAIRNTVIGIGSLDPLGIVSALPTYKIHARGILKDWPLQSR